MTALPLAGRWYGVERLDGRVTRITEPHVHPIFAANMHLVEGSQADLLIDAGMGVAPLGAVLDGLRDPAKPLMLLATHAHVDHVGAAHEFGTRLAHPLEAEAMAHPAPYSLDAADIPDRLAALFEAAGYPPLRPLLIDALPWEGYDPASWTLRPAPPTALVTEGHVIDLGDWRAEVLHLPGHSPGQVGLWHEPSGTLFGADAIYDGPLIFEGPGTSVPDYAATLRRIAALAATRVHGGHDPDFGPERMRAICDDHLGRWAREGRI